MDESRHYAFSHLLALWNCEVSHTWNEAHLISNESCPTSNEACHIWMSHVTYKWVTSQCPLATSFLALWNCEVSHAWNEAHHTSNESRPTSHESRHVWMSHVTYKWVMSQCPLATSSPCGIVKWVTHEMRHVMYQMSHVLHQMSHVIFEWVVSHAFMCHIHALWSQSLTNDERRALLKSDSHVSRTSDEARHISNESHHISMSHVTHEWVMECWHVNASRDICMSHVTYKWVAYDTRHVMYEMSHVPHECHGSCERVMARMKRRRGLM